MHTFKKFRQWINLLKKKLKIEKLQILHIKEQNSFNKIVHSFKRIGTFGKHQPNRSLKINTVREIKIIRLGQTAHQTLGKRNLVNWKVSPRKSSRASLSFSKMLASHQWWVSQNLLFPMFPFRPTSSYEPSPTTGVRGLFPPRAVTVFPALGCSVT